MTNAFLFFEIAQDWVKNSPYADEPIWQSDVLETDFTESDFLREYAWVVLNSGFRESVVRSKFEYISLCFCDWESADEIIASQDQCVASALSSFANRRKLLAITSVARIIQVSGWDNLHKELNSDPLPAIEALPFMGKVTSRHLAKNIGIDCSKPDRHLARAATKFGYDTADLMCRDIGNRFSLNLAVVDIILWRYISEHDATIRLRG